MLRVMGYVVAGFAFLACDWSTNGALVAEEGNQRQATTPASIRVKEGFRVELLRSAQEGESSWISMTWEPTGNLLLGLDDQGIARLRLGDAGKPIVWERLSGSENFRHVRGILYAHDSLYVSATDSQEVYRLMDRDGDGEYEQRQLFQRLAYNSRYGHGMNQIVLGPDGMLYFVVGNDVVFPDNIDPQSPYRGPQKDWLLTHPADDGQDDRVGYIARVDPEGKNWKIIAGGLRNQFDLAFDADGEMFTWDADMEWDVGLPWYRPTRLNHIVPGGEYGWRWGTGKWPAWYPDSLPSTLDTGYSSPTALTFGYSSHWPDRFRRALFMADWQLGRIFSVDLDVDGASYQAEASVFVEGGPLNVCDMSFGPDGALYFITGGRGSQSGLYRVQWIGADIETEVVANDESQTETIDLRATRRKLEVLQELQDANQFDFIWQQLASEDRWIRFAARVAMENQDMIQWQKAVEGYLANGEAGERTQTERSLHMALLGMARVGGVERRAWVLEQLLSSDWDNLATDELVVVLRALQLNWLRQGMPSIDEQKAILARLEPHYPHSSFAVNWLMCELLVRMKSEHVLEKTLQLLQTNVTQEEEFQYVKTLMHLEGPWSLESSEQMLDWFLRSRRYRGGRLVETVWNQLRERFLGKLSDDQQQQFAARIERLNQAEVVPGESEIAPPRAFVQDWTVEELLEDVQAIDQQLANVQQENRSSSRSLGLQALEAAACLKCHQFGERGTHVGPDLTGVAKRFDGRALLESIIEPSRQIDPKYLNTAYLLANGKVIAGRTVGVSRSQLVIETDALTGRTETVERSEIEQSSPAELSPMPQGLLNTLSRDEVLALVRLLREGL